MRVPAQYYQWQRQTGDEVDDEPPQQVVPAPPGDEFITFHDKLVIRWLFKVTVELYNGNNNMYSAYTTYAHIHFKIPWLVGEYNTYKALVSQSKDDDGSVVASC